MIIVTRSNGRRFSINPDLLQRIDAAPHTVLTLVDGTQYAVEETMPQVIDLVSEYRAALMSRAQEPRSGRGDDGADVYPRPTESRPRLRSVPEPSRPQ